MKPFIHPSSIVHPKALIGEGSEVMEFCCIGSQPMTFKRYERTRPEAGIIIGKNVFVNTGSHIVLGSKRDTLIEDDVIIGQNVVIGHDSIIGRKAKIMNGVTLNGWDEIGKLSFIGARSVLRERIKVGENTVIGMGSVVTRDMPDNVIAYGSPCKVIRRNNHPLKDFAMRLLL